MRFAPTLLVSSLAGLLAPSVVAVHPVALTHTSPSRSLARLQHHEPRADLIDVCINIPNLVLDVLQLLDADIKLCVCLQDLNLYLSTIDDVKVQQQVAVAINATINGNDSLPRCALPPHAHRACTTADPCHIECDPGFTREGDQCVCAPPNVICSGQCGPPTAGCGASALARSLKSRHAPITTLARARAFCGSKAVCGVSDPKSDLDSSVSMWPPISTVAVVALLPIRLTNPSLLVPMVSTAVAFRTRARSAAKRMRASSGNAAMVSRSAPTRASVFLWNWSLPIGMLITVVD
ncbi:hypothetical protein B0H10DRAFT_1186472 [Mycena sp. CBHHK59/15]|nr:hypothetical protein B0H10DRAFT_1186472 [Mycena sp. CBHHK59/15]